MALTGREKATIFLSILGADVSSRILRYLPGELADLIASGINHLPTPSPEALAEVLSQVKARGVRVCWLHPTKEAPTSAAMVLAAPYVTRFLPAHNLASLSRLPELLA